MDTMIRACRGFEARLPKGEDEEQIRTILWKNLIKQRAKAASVRIPREVVQG
eukprot:GAHX01002386.1.p2 GENE.GAHX01002386.1~~GAHX01002386.1.p2  ORF type:complete len:52 (-),score=5.71 GAHX01002386.1:39-194(-)